MDIFIQFLPEIFHTTFESPLHEYSSLFAKRSSINIKFTKTQNMIHDTFNYKMLMVNVV